MPLCVSVSSTSQKMPRKRGPRGANAATGSITLKVITQIGEEAKRRRRRIRQQLDGGRQIVEVIGIVIVLIEHVVELSRELQLVLQEAQAEAELQIRHRRQSIEGEVRGSCRRRRGRAQRRAVDHAAARARRKAIGILEGAEDAQVEIEI